MVKRDDEVRPTRSAECETSTTASGSRREAAESTRTFKAARATRAPAS